MKFIIGSVYRVFEKEAHNFICIKSYYIVLLFPNEFLYE